MKIKRFNESRANGEPWIKDYVICEFKDSDLDIHKFLNNNIGRIRENRGKVKQDDKYVTAFSVNYKNIPDNLLEYFRYETMSDQMRDLFSFSKDKKMVIDVRESDIIAWSPKIEDVEVRLSTNKFNL